MPIAAAGLLPANWQTRLPNNSTPYTSTIVFLVRKGNPKGIHDWDDLRAAGRCGHHPQPQDLRRRALELPRRLGLRAARANGGSEAKARDFVTRLYKNVPVLDTGARGSTITFVERGIGDVLIAWENEASAGGQGARQGEVRDRRAVGLSILAEPPVAVVDKVAHEARHRGGRQGLSRVPLLARGPGDRRPQLLPPAQSRRSPPSTPAQFPQRAALHHRRALRRLDEGAEDALRRRRRLRPDLPGGRWSSG